MANSSINSRIPFLGLFNDTLSDSHHHARLELLRRDDGSETLVLNGCIMIPLGCAGITQILEDQVFGIRALAIAS